jgi:hypothetical protein
MMCGYRTLLLTPENQLNNSLKIKNLVHFVPGWNFGEGQPGTGSLLTAQILPSPS